MISPAIRPKRTLNLRRIKPASNAVISALFIVIALACILPVILVIMISITDEMTVLSVGYSLFPTKFSGAAYDFIFRRGSMIMRAYGITIFTTMLGMLCSTTVIALFAYPLSRTSFRYKKFFSRYVLITMLFSGGLVPWVMVYTQLLKVNNSIPVLIIPHLMNCWYVMIMRTFFRTAIPEELLEAARIDGASEYRTFASVVIPLSTAGIATIALFSTLAYWNDWYLPLMFITNNKLYNIQYLMKSMLDNVQFLANAAGSGVTGAADAIRNMPSETVRMGIAVIAIGPIVFAYPFFQRYFIQGLTIGAVKG